MKRNYSLKLIRSRHSYTFEEISELLNVHSKTIQIWKKEGLNVIDSTKPYLVMGYDLKTFLQEKFVKRRLKLQQNEFFCTKCRKAMISNHNEVNLYLTGKTIGKNAFKEVVIKGACDICSTKLNRFSHSGKIDEIKTNFNVIDFGGLENE